MWCKGKKEMLEHLGKNPKDVRWLDRAVEKGIIWKEQNDYILCTEYIEDLRGRKEIVDKNDNQEKNQNPVVDKNDNSKVDDGKIKELEQKNQDLFDAYVRALKRQNEKNDFIDKLIFAMKKVDDPKSQIDDGDYKTMICERYGYNPKGDE